MIFVHKYIITIIYIFIIKSYYIISLSSTSIQSQMKSDNPLDLSISLSGGKETNKDALSIGE